MVLGAFYQTQHRLHAPNVHIPLLRPCGVPVGEEIRKNLRPSSSTTPQADFVFLKSSVVSLSQQFEQYSQKNGKLERLSVGCPRELHNFDCEGGQGQRER
jgi:hypothetical protein